MELLKVRRCFACNSSSTHSIILLKDGFRPKTSRDALEGDFNWNKFTAADKRTKARYLAATLRQQLRVDYPNKYAWDLPPNEQATSEANAKLADQIVLNLMKEAMGDVLADDDLVREDTVDHQRRVAVVQQELDRLHAVVDREVVQRRLGPGL